MYYFSSALAMSLLCHEHLPNLFNIKRLFRLGQRLLHCLGTSLNHFALVCADNLLW